MVRNAILSAVLLLGAGSPAGAEGFDLNSADAIHISRDQYGVPRIPTVFARSAPLRIEGHPISRRESIPAAEGHQHTVSAYLSAYEDPSHLEGIYSDCDDTIDDCSFLIFDFPQLKRDAKSGSLSFEGSEVAVVSGKSVALAKGFRLGFTRHNTGGQDYWVSVYIEKAPAGPSISFYEGELKLKDETRRVCFALSAEKIDQFEGDPDVSHGVFVYQEIPVFIEKGSGFSGECRTALEHNGGYIRTCSGLFMTDAPSLGKGDVFTSLSRFDPQTGGLRLQPVGGVQD